MFKYYGFQSVSKNEIEIADSILHSLYGKVGYWGVVKGEFIQIFYVRQ